MIREFLLAVVLGVAWCVGSTASADEAGDVAALKEEVARLKAEIANMRGAAAPSAEGVSRFNGVWEGEITRDERNDCLPGSIKLTVKDGKVEGFRWFRQQPAPAKGIVHSDGSFEGYTNQAEFVGTFAGDVFEGYWPKYGCVNQKALMRRVSVGQ